MELEPVIGLEIHVQLATKSKMFCSCQNDSEGLAGNTAICPICTGQPGTLPVPNGQAINYGIKAGLAIGCRIPNESKFDRKHYFYPDLPKGYQITQYDEPVAVEGMVNVERPDGTTFQIRIERLHLEEDAAKNVHLDNATYVDYNRAGTPLAEIVTRPDFKTPADAKLFLQELRLIMRTIGVSNADMEKGNMRCDANISMRPHGDEKYYPKTEVKNLNSFRSVERALEYEIKRQSALWHTNTPPIVTTTHGWDEARQQTVLQRTKEAANDYRYFPEPDIPPLLVADIIDEIRNSMPELPTAKRHRLQDEYQFKPTDARQLVDSPELCAFAENAMSECAAWLDTLGDGNTERDAGALGKLVGGWITSKLLGLLATHNETIATMKLTPENFAELMALVATRRVNSTIASKLLETMIKVERSPQELLEEMGVGSMEETTGLPEVIDRIILNNPLIVEQYKNGKVKLIEFLVGQTMKEMKGAADPEEIRKMLKEKIG